MSTTRTSGRQLSERQGSGMSRRGRRFVAAVTALMLALPTMTGMFGFNTPAYADDLTDTVPNNDDGYETIDGNSFYSGTINTGFGPDGPYGEITWPGHGPEFGPYGPITTADGKKVLQSQSTTSPTSFAAGLPLGTIFIDQKKVSGVTPIYKVVSDKTAIIAGLGVEQMSDGLTMGYDGTKTGAIKMVPGKINKLDGDLFTVKYEDAAILPNGERADLVITYSNAQIVIDQRYLAAPDGETYYELITPKRSTDIAYQDNYGTNAWQNPAGLTQLDGETFGGNPVFKDATGYKYVRITASNGNNRYYAILDLGPSPDNLDPNSLSPAGRTHTYKGKEYPVYTDGTKEYILPDNEQYYHGSVGLARGNLVARSSTDFTRFRNEPYLEQTRKIVNDTISSEFGDSYIYGTNQDASTNQFPVTGTTLDVSYKIVNKDGTPAAGTFVFAVAGINLDRDPDTGTAGNNFGRPLWYTYTDNFGGENGKDHSFFTEALEILGGQVSDNVYVRPNIGIPDNPAETRTVGRYFWANVSLHDGNIKFIGNGVNKDNTTGFPPEGLQGNDKSYSAGFVTLANAATGFKIRHTGHGGAGGGMNSGVFESMQIWYRYTESTGKHGSIAVTSEGNFGGTLDDGGAVYKPEGTWDNGDEWDGNGTPSGIGQAATHVVAEGKTVTYTMTPDIGYKISKLWVGAEWNDDQSPIKYREITFNDDAIAAMKKGDTLEITTAAGNKGLLTYKEDGTYTLTFEYAQNHEAVHVEWEPTTADILVAKVWDDKDDKDGLRKAAYADPATTPKFKLQYSTNRGGDWHDVQNNSFAGVTAHPVTQIDQPNIPDGKVGDKYLDGTYPLNRDTTGEHPFTWEYLPVYSYDNNGVADKAILYRLVEIPDPAVTDYEKAQYSDSQTFELLSSMSQSVDGWLIQEDSTDNKKYIKKGDGQYYEVNPDTGVASTTPATPQPKASNLEGAQSNSYYTVDKGIAYFAVQAKNEHKPREVYIDLTKFWNDKVVQGLTATDGNAYGRRDLTFVLHGETDDGAVDLNGSAEGTDREITITIVGDNAESDAKADVTGDKTVQEDSKSFTVYKDGQDNEYAYVTGHSNPDIADGYYPLSGDTIDYANGPVAGLNDLTPVAKGDGTYKIDDDHFGALIEHLSTHNAGKPITYTVTEKIGGKDANDSELPWTTTGGNLSPVKNDSGETIGYTTEFVNTPVVDKDIKTLPLSIVKKDAVTGSVLENATFTVYTNATSKEKATEHKLEKIGDQQVYTNDIDKYVKQNDTYYKVNEDGTVATEAANPQPDTRTLKESYSGSVEKNEVTTNAQGTATINFHEPGTYYVVETKAPTGYNVDSTTYTFKVDKELKSVIFKEADENHSTSFWESIYNLLFKTGLSTDPPNWTYSEDKMSGTLTVKDDPIRANILINKVWDDNNNQDGLRTAGELPKVKIEKTTNPADDSSWVPVNSTDVPAPDKTIPAVDAPMVVDQDNYYTWDNLPAYESGKLIYYRVVEFGGSLPLDKGGVFLPGGDHAEETAYAWTALTATGNEKEFNIANITDPDDPTSRNRTVTVTNKHVPQKFTLNVSKEWADEKGDTSKRKTTKITLYKTVNGAGSIVEERENVVPFEPTTQTTFEDFTIFKDLPVYENGYPITYRVEETAIDHYGTTYKRTYDLGSGQETQGGNSVDASTVKRTFGPEKVGDYPVYTDESGNQYAYVTGEASVTDGYYAVSGDAIDYDTSYAGDPSELTVTREETTEAEIEVKNAKLTEVTVEKTWFNGATENVIYYLYRTTSTDENVTDWTKARGQGKKSKLDDTKTVYNWDPENDSNWELVTDENGKAITHAFPASAFDNKSEAEQGSTKDYTFPNLPVADPYGNPYIYRVYEDGSNTVDKFEANQVSNTKVENTNARAKDGIAHVNVVKELEGREWNNDDKFYFKIEPYEDGSASANYNHAGACGVDQNGNEITDCSTVPMPKDSANNPKNIQEVKKSDTQVGAIGRNVGFTPITYTSADVDMGKSAEYYYKVYEVYNAQGRSLDDATEHTGKKAGITYDGEVEEGLVSDTFKPTEHFLKVVVTSDPNGVMTTTLYWDGSDKPSAVPVYTNRYDASAKINAHIIKEVKGRQIIGNDKFNFSISNIGGAPLRANETDNATVVTGVHDAGSIEKDTGSKVTGTGAYNPIEGENGNFRAIKSVSTNWIKVGDLSQKTADGKATDTFIYRLTENAPDASENPSVANEEDLIFDTSHIYIKIVATDNLDGTIDIQKTYWYDETCTKPVGTSVLVDSEGNIAPAGATSDDEDGDGNKLYDYEPAAIFTNTQTIDIPVIKEWKGGPAVENVTLRLKRKLIPLSAESGLTYSDAESAAGYNNKGWEDVGNVTTALRDDFFKDDGTPNYNALSPLTATKTYEDVDGFNMNLPKYVTVGGTTYRAVYKLFEDPTSDAYETTYYSKKGDAKTDENRIFIDGETLVVTNKVTATNEANIAAVKQLLGRQWLSTDDFSFTLEPAGKGKYKDDGSFDGINSSDDAKAAVPMPENNRDRKSETTGTGKDTVATTHAWDEANNANSIVVDQNGDLERLARFGKIKFDINDLTWVNDHYEGDFFYTMKEKLPEGATQNTDGTYTKDGITYDTDSHTVHVKVTGNRTNQLYVQIAYDESTVGDASTGTQFTPVYTNRYDAVGTQNAQINKYIMGRDFASGETFTFKVTPLGDTPMVDAETGDRLDSREGTLTVSGTSAPQTLTLPNIKFILDDLPWTVGESGTTDARDGTAGPLTYSDDTTPVAGMKYGRFMYAFTETGASASDLNLDTDTEYVQVTVIDKGDGVLDTQVKYFEDRYGIIPRYTPNDDGTPSTTPATATVFVNKLKRNLSVTKAWDAPATSDVTLKLQWSTDNGATWNDADGTSWLAKFPATQTIEQNAAVAGLTKPWSGLPAYAPDGNDTDLDDKWVRYRVVEDDIANVDTRYSTEAYANGDKATDSKYSENPIATEAAPTDTRVTQIYVTNFVEDLEGTASVNVVKQLIGRGWTDSDSFGFTITPVESKIGKETTAKPASERAMPMPMGTDDNGDPAVDNTATATKTGSRPVTVGEYNATFEDIVIKLSDLALNDKNIATGEFVYTIKEAIPEGATPITDTNGKTLYYVKGNIKYTAEEHTVKIVATNDGTGTIDTTVSYDDRPAGDFVPVYTNEAIVPTPIKGSKTWVGGEASEHINANGEGVDARGIALQRKTAADTTWTTLRRDDADRELVVVWDNATGNSDYTVMAEKSATENVDPVLDMMDNDGYKYEYRISEGNVPDDYADTYATSGVTNNDITNTSTKKDSLKVTKTWDDGDNAEGLRPDKVTMHLYKEVTVPAATPGDPATTETIQVEVAKKEITKKAGDGDDTWTTGITWNDLPVYDKDGNKITYVVIEENEFGYKATYKVLNPAAAGYTEGGNSLTLDGDKTAEVQTIDVKNTLEPATDTVTVTKVWNDNNNQDGKRPPLGVSVNVYEYVWNKDVNADDYEAGEYVKNTTPVKTFKLDGTANDDTTNKVRELTPENANKWKGEFYDLPMTKNGKTVFYTVVEDQVADYEAPVVTGNQVDGFTVTNTHKPAKGCVEVQKIWNDNNNQDGKRTDVTMTLKSTVGEGENANTIEVGSKVISADMSKPQEAEWHNLPVFRDGKKITYTVVESGADSAYTTTYSEGVQLASDGDTKTLTVTNKYTPAKMTVTATKEWDDNNNQDGMRTSVTLYLKGTVTGSNVALSFADKAVATGTNHDQNMTATWENLPVYHDGKEIAYTVTEEAIPGYEAKVTGNTTDGFTVTNKLTPAVTSVTVTKVWDDADNQDGLRRNAIVHLDKTVDGTTTQDVEDAKALAVGAGHVQGMTGTWKNLPAYENGEKITYTVREDAIDGYTTEITGDAANGFTITNRHPAETINIQATKVWNDAALMNGDTPIEGYDRPKTVSLQLKADGTAVGAPVAVSKSSKVGDTEWAHQWTGLPKYKDGGTAIAYTVEEVEVPYGYEAKVTGNMADGFTVTNTPKVSEVLGADLVVKKVDKSTGKPMKGVTFTLKSDSVEGFTTVTQTTNDGGVATFTFDKEGEYTLTETIPVGYEDPDPASYTITVSKDGTSTHVELEPSDRNAFQKIYDLVFDGGGANYDATAKMLTVENTPKTNKVTVRKQFVDTDMKPIPLSSIPEDFVIHADYTALENGVGVEKTATLKISEAIYSDGTYRWELENVVYGTDVHVHEMKYLNVTGYDFTSTEVTPPDGAKTHGDDANFTMPNEKAMVTFANTYTKQAGNLELVKNWNDEGNRDSKRPTSVEFTVTASAPVFGTAAEPSTTKTVTLTGDATADSWSDTSLTGLPLYYNGEIVTYTVDEATVADYTKAIDQDNGVTLTKGETKTLSITNSHLPEAGSLTVTKVWDDANNQAQKRPETVTFRLFANGEDTGKTVTLSATDAAADDANRWTKVDAFTVPNFDEAGKPITYTVREDVSSELAAAGYTDSGEAGADKDYTITNTYMSVSGEITVVKKDSTTGDPLAGAEFTLSDPYGTEFKKTTGEDGKATFTLDAEGGWTLVETGVPENHKLDDVYSWTIKAKADKDKVTVEQITEGEDTFWKKVMEVIVDLTADGFDKATNTLTVGNPPIDEKTITYVDPDPEDPTNVEKIQEDVIKVGENEPGQPADPTRDGYIFGGWLRETDPNTGDVIYKANWIKIPDPGEKEIKYVDPSKPEGEQEVLREVITRGENEPAQPADPTRDGWKFTGWKRTIDEDGNVTYTATWEEIPGPERVKITYDPANGEDKRTETINRNENEPGQPADPTRDGFIFTGWQRVEDEDGNVTYTARWKEIPASEQIKVTYDFDNGEEKVETVIERGKDEPNQPADPTRDGYIFGGWIRTMDEDGNVTYKARWIEAPDPTEKITITRDPGNGADPTVVEIERGQNEPGQPGDPIRDGYEFMGWDRTVDSETGNVIYKARWKKLDLTDAITITYDPANGEDASSTHIERGTNEPGQPEPPTRDGYIFGGWLRTFDEDGNVTYTANWIETTTPDPGKITVTYDFDNGKDDPEVSTIERGTNEPGQPADPTRDGYVFGGWIRTQDDAGNVVYKARWIDSTMCPAPTPTDPSTIWVTYVDEDGTVYVEKTTIAKGTKEPSAPADPKREGYVFDGWDRVEDENGNITYTARWKKTGTSTPPGTSKTPPEVSERTLSAIPLSNTGEAVGTAGMAALMFTLLGGGLLARRRQRAMSEE